MRTPLRCLAGLAGILFAVAALAQTSGQRRVPDPKLELSARVEEATPYGLQVAVTIRNIGGTAQVNLGTILSDQYLRPNLKLTLVKDGKQYNVLSVEEGQHAEGKIYPLTVVLAQGSSYTLSLPLRGYVVIVTGAHDPMLDDFFRLGDQLQVEMVSDEEDTRFARYYGQGCDLLPCWTGKLKAIAILP